MTMENRGKGKKKEKMKKEIFLHASPKLKETIVSPKTSQSTCFPIPCFVPRYSFTII